MMEAYISRYKDENVMSILEDVKHNSEYGCAERRLHFRAREAVTRFTNIATERPKDIKKTSNPCMSSSMITLKSIMRFLMLSYFNYWQWNAWEQDFFKPNTWTMIVLIEVQKVSPACSGNWETEIARHAASAHYLNIWRSSDLTSNLISILNIDQLGISHCTTILCHCYQEPRASPVFEL